MEGRLSDRPLPRPAQSRKAQEGKNTGEPSFAYAVYPGNVGQHCNRSCWGVDCLFYRRTCGG